MSISKNPGRRFRIKNSDEDPEALWILSLMRASRARLVPLSDTSAVAIDHCRSRFAIGLFYLNDLELAWLLDARCGRCAVSGMALTPSSQQLMSPFHRNMSRFLFGLPHFSLKFHPRQNEWQGQREYSPGIVTVISHPYTATLRSSLRLPFRTLNAGLQPALCL